MSIRRFAAPLLTIAALAAILPTAAAAAPAHDASAVQPAESILGFTPVQNNLGGATDKFIINNCGPDYSSGSIITYRSKSTGQVFCVIYTCDGEFCDPVPTPGTIP